MLWFGHFQVFIANNFLLEHNNCYKTIPIPIEYIIEYHLRLDIVPMPNLQRDFDIDGYTSIDLTTIYVDEFVYENRFYRYRFTLAHEIGHVVLHKRYFKQIQFKSIVDWKNFIKQLDRDDRSKLEFQGYAFGGLLLAPPKQLRGFFQVQGRTGCSWA